MPDRLTEFANANAQDPAVPVDSQVGCAEYQGWNGDMAQFYRFTCHKDTPRLLYTAGDRDCTTRYYCRITEDSCPLPSEG